MANTCLSSWGFIATLLPEGGNFGSSRAEGLEETATWLN
jgi:hypothetical protein